MQSSLDHIVSHVLFWAALPAKLLRSFPQKHCSFTLPLRALILYYLAQTAALIKSTNGL